MLVRGKCGLAECIHANDDDSVVAEWIGFGRAIESSSE